MLEENRRVEGYEGDCWRCTIETCVRVTTKVLEKYDETFGVEQWRMLGGGQPSKSWILIFILYPKK